METDFMSDLAPSRLSWCAIACLAMIGTAAHAQKAPSMTAPRVDIIGKRDNLERISGSGDIIDRDALESTRVFTVNEALRKVPGINVRDEEGFGLRPNIGIRGLNPTRSTKVTLLEDGIPLAYAPYGDNASYYHPPIERFERVEVLRGAGQTLYGPQTIGGVINYITPNPTEDFSGGISIAGGNRDYLNAHARLSGGGFLLDVMQKQGLGARDNTRAEIGDINLKKVFKIDDRQGFTLRANYFTDDSQVTYSGLTNAEFRNFGARYNPFKNDTFETRRMGLSGTHQIALSGDTSLITNVYWSSFNRDWWRQSSTTTDTQCGTGFRDARIAGQAVNVDSCNSAQGRLRDYYQFGIEPRLRTTHTWFGTPSELETGVRLHHEKQERRQVNASSPLGRVGSVSEDNERDTSAIAAFAQNRLLYGDFAITPGLRYEYIDVSRTDRRAGGNSGSESLSAFIPSLAATYKVQEGTTVFAGVHRGFAPPRVEDIIQTGIGPVATFTNVGAERSWNFELGTRSQVTKELGIQATYFRNDFQRLIAVGSIAGGSINLSQGEALFQGIELGSRYGHASGLYSTAAITWLPTAEQSTSFNRVDTGAAIAGSVAGKRMPYAPKTTATIGVGYATSEGLDVNLEAVHVGAQYADFANIQDPNSDASGQFGKIDAFTIFNATANYQIRQYGMTVFLSVKNLTDKVYIVDRTRGILPGAPRLIQAGLRWDF
jgi:Fe(3+) dicitrate transport protein